MTSPEITNAMVEAAALAYAKACGKCNRRGIRAALSAALAAGAPGVTLSDAQIKHMAERFLRWKLPENFRPDGGVSFERDYNQNTPWPARHEPTGTNLFDYNQAKDMVRFMADGLPGSEPAPSALVAEPGEPVAWRFRWRYPKPTEYLTHTTWVETGSAIVAQEREREGYEVEPLYLAAPSASQEALREDDYALLTAAKKVMDGLNARIDAASAEGRPVPLFHGIADLHDAINAADAALAQSAPVKAGG